MLNLAKVSMIPRTPWYQYYGAKEAWSPSEILSIVWFDGLDTDTITVETGISEWLDKSGNDRHLTQADTAKQPLFVDNGAVFDGIDTILNHPAAFTYDSGDVMAFVVMDASPQDQHTVIGEGNLTLTNPESLFRTGIGGNDHRMSARQRNDGGTTSASNTTPANALDGTRNIQYWINSQNTTVDPGNWLVLGRTNGGGFSGYGANGPRGGAMTLDNFTVGAHNRGGTEQQWLDSTINEILIVPANEDYAEYRQVIEGYLAWKWEIEDKLPSGHPYENAPPTAGALPPAPSQAVLPFGLPGILQSLPPVNLTIPVISGTPEVGETLTTTDGTWQNDPTSFTYQWLRDDAPIAGATSSSYLLVGADGDTDIKAEVMAINIAGSESVESATVNVPQNEVAFFNQTYAGRDFENNPLTISGLDGDTYDYKVIIKKDSASPSTSFNIRFNNDITSGNYRRYRVLAFGASKFGQVSDNESSVPLQDFNDLSTINMFDVLGSSGSERHLRSRWGRGSLEAYIDGYWKNVVDNVTSMTITGDNDELVNAHVIVYQIPKVGDQGNWEHVETLQWSAETGAKDFTGLDGDVDKKYRLIWEANTDVQYAPNANFGAFYKTVYLDNQNGSLPTSSFTDTGIRSRGIQAESILSAETGKERTITFYSSDNTDTTQQSRIGVWYTNTVTNITSIRCTPVGITTGTMKLYKLKDNSIAADILPFETVEEVEFTNEVPNHVFSGLDGDNEILYKIEWEGYSNSAGSSDIIFMRPNNDSSSEANQFLNAGGGTVNAGAPLDNYKTIASTPNGAVSRSEMYFYPKSGSSRPIITDYISDEIRINFFTNAWEDTVSNLTSINISGVGNLTGKLKLSRLKP